MVKWQFIEVKARNMLDVSSCFFMVKALTQKAPIPTCTIFPRGTHLVRNEQLAAIAVVTQPWTAEWLKGNVTP